MSDDSFIREVNEEIRQERARALWGRYGPLLILLAILIVLGTAGWQGYQYWQAGKAGTIGAQFVTALDSASRGDMDKAMAELDSVAASQFGGYPALADMRAASLLAQQGKNTEAVSRFDAVANNSATPDVLKRIARVRAAYILVDIGSYDDVKAKIGDMATDIDELRAPAREALGLAAWKAGNIGDAVGYFEKNAEDGAPSDGSVQRAQMMLDLIHSSGQAQKG